MSNVTAKRGENQILFDGQRPILAGRLPHSEHDGNGIPGRRAQRDEAVHLENPGNHSWRCSCVLHRGVKTGDLRGYRQ